MTRKKLGLIAGLLLLALAIGFGCGSLWMAVKTSNAQTLTRVLRSWMSPIELLTQNSYTIRSNPTDVTRNLGWSLDLASIRLAYVYDDLPQDSKDRIAQYANVARNLAVAQQGNGSMNDRRHLLIFAECLQKTQKAGASVRNCAKQNGMYGRSTASTGARSPFESGVADAR